MLKYTKKILEDVKKFDESEYEYLLEQLECGTSIETYFEDVIMGIFESISEFGYSDEKGWEYAFNWLCIALKYKYYKNIEECMTDIWHNAFGLWVDENQRGNMHCFESSEIVKEYIFNVFNLASKLNRYDFEVLNKKRR